MPGLDVLVPLYVDVNSDATITVKNTGNVAVYYQAAKNSGTTISAAVNDGSIAAGTSLAFGYPVFLLASSAGAQVDVAVSNPSRSSTSASAATANGPTFTGSGYNLIGSAANPPFLYPSTSGNFNADTHWADWDHAEVPALGANTALQIVRAPWTSTGLALRVECRNGWRAASDGAGVDRVELTAQGVGTTVAKGWGDGTDVWWAYSAMLDPVTFASGLPTSSGNPIWLLVHQFFNANLGSGATGTTAGSPGLDIELSSAAGFLVTFRGGAQATAGSTAPVIYAWTLGSQPAELGLPHDFLIRYKYSSSNNGILQIYYRLRGNQFPEVPQINLYAGQNVTAPTDGSKIGGVGAGSNIFNGITARTVNSPNVGEVINYYPEGGTYRLTPDASPATTVVYQGGLFARLTRTEAEACLGPAPATRVYTRSFQVSGTVAVPVGGTNYIPPYTEKVPTGSKKLLIGVVYGVRGGTSATFAVQQNGVNVTNLAALVATTTQTETDLATGVAVVDGDRFQPVVSAVSGTPDGLNVDLVFVENVY